MIFPIHHLPDVIRVGVQTEQDVTVIGFDLKPWLDALPDMKFTVWPTRPGEEEAYRAKDQLMVGTVLYWHPDGYDTEIAGQGRVEIAGVGKNQRKASGFTLTDVRATSLGKTKEPGESVAPWYESILKAAEEIKDAHGDGGLFLVREVNHVADRTVAEIVEAADAGKTVLLVKTGGKVYMLNNVILDKPTFYAVQSGTLQNQQGFGIVVSEAWIDTDGMVKGVTPNVSKTPNPYPIKLIGAVNATYDGSSPVTVEIPQGGSGGGEGACIVNIVVGEPMEEPNMSIFATQFQVTSADKTLAEVQQALDAGRNAIVRADMGGICVYMPIVMSQTTALVFSTYSQGQSFGATTDESGDWFFGFMRTLNGGGDATTDVFYTADGQTFTTVDAAVLHVQKGEQ